MGVWIEASDIDELMHEKVSSLKRSDLYIISSFTSRRKNIESIIVIMRDIKRSCFMSSIDAYLKDVRNYGHTVRTERAETDLDTIMEMIEEDISFIDKHFHNIVRNYNKGR